MKPNLYVRKLTAVLLGVCLALNLCNIPTVSPLLSNYTSGTELACSCVTCACPDHFHANQQDICSVRSIASEASPHKHAKGLAFVQCSGTNPPALLAGTEPGLLTFLDNAPNPHSTPKISYVTIERLHTKNVQSYVFRPPRQLPI